MPDESEQQLELDEDSDCIEELPTVHALARHVRRTRLLQAALNMEQLASDYGIVGGDDD